MPFRVVSWVIRRSTSSSVFGHVSPRQGLGGASDQTSPHALAGLAFGRNR